MKKQAALTLLLFIFLTSTAFAAPDKKNEHATENKEKNNKPNIVELLEEITITPTDTTTPTPTVTPTVIPTTTVSVTPSPSVTCDENGEWKNHGKYVSCVAKQHLGGQAVSEAAKSDIGKKKHVTPTVTVTTSPTGGPTVTTTPTVTVTPPITASLEESTFSFLPSWGELKKSIAKLLNVFKRHN